MIISISKKYSFKWIINALLGGFFTKLNIKNLAILNLERKVGSIYDENVIRKKGLQKKSYRLVG